MDISQTFDSSHTPDSLAVVFPDELTHDDGADAADEIPLDNLPASAPLADAELAYIRDVSCIPLLTHDEEFNCARASRRGDLACRDRMIYHNLRLVLSLARRYRNRGLCLMDMVSEGNFGLIRAVEKYDPDLGYRFSTYATWWIRQAIDRAIMNHARDVRLPVHLIKEISQCRRVETRLTHELGRRPRRAELAACCQLTLEALSLILDCHESSYDIQQAIPETDDLESACTGHLSRIGDPVAQVQSRGLYATAWRWLDELSERQREVLKRRFGLAGHTAATLEQVGSDIGLTRERVRQIQIEALGRLKRLARRDGYGADAFFGQEQTPEHAYLNAC
jgi:RNA polymerase nonessential primary-like sigma factor